MRLDRDSNFRFGVYEIDFGAGEVRKAGVPVPVEPQVFDLIALLASRPGELVSRDEVIEAVWHGRIVSESAIATRINAARAALGDDGKAQKMIQTVPRRGFRFVGGALDSTPDLTLPDKPSIAVLPFENMSGNPEQEFFSDGIADDIITELARYDELFVIARNSSFAFKGRSVDVRKIARELGVQFVLEGSVRRAGGRVRVTAQLIDTASGNHVWADRYDRELEDIFAVQDEITAVIVNTLVGKVMRSHFDRALLKAPENMDAYDHALRAMVHFQRWTPDDNRIARLEAEKALALDPEFARAEALLGWSNGADFILHWGDDRQLSRETALQSGKRAVALDNMEPWAHAALGFAHVYCARDFDYGLASIIRAVELNPNNAHFHGWLAIVQCFNGEPEKAFTEIEAAARLNPLSPPIYSHIRARILFTLGRLEEALSLITQLTVEMPKVPNALAMAAACNEALGKHEAARALIDRLQAGYPDYAISTVRFSSPYRRDPDLASYCDLLRRAGLRE